MHNICTWLSTLSAITVFQICVSRRSLEEFDGIWPGLVLHIVRVFFQLGVLLLAELQKSSRSDCRQLTFFRSVWFKWGFDSFRRKHKTQLGIALEVICQQCCLSQFSAAIGLGQCCAKYQKFFLGNASAMRMVGFETSYFISTWERRWSMLCKSVEQIFLQVLVGQSWILFFAFLFMKTNMAAT